MTREPAQQLGASHPLVADPQLLSRLVEVMQATIQKVLHFGPDSRGITVKDGRLTPSQSSSSERVLAGGASVEDVLQDAFISLLKHDPNRVTSWMALGHQIAHARAVDALRRATKGRKTVAGGGQDGDDEIGLASIDVALDIDRSFGTSSDSTEDEYLHIEQQLVMRRVARDVLSERDLKIFLEIHFGRARRVELAADFEISSARVSQIYRKAERAVRASSRDDPAFSVRDDREEDQR